MALNKKDIVSSLDAWSEGESIRSICKRLGCAAQSFYDAIWNDAELTERHARAKQVRAELDVDELISIADNDPDPHRARIRIDTRRWTASKMNPKLYGERMDINVNQTIDIGGALMEARARALPNQTDLIEIEATKRIEGTASKAVDAVDTPEENESIDIFS